MELYVNQNSEGSDLEVGDIIRSKRGIHSLVIAKGECLAVITEKGKFYTMSFEQGSTNKRLARTSISGLTVEYVFSESFVSALVANYNEELTKASVLAQLKDIPTEVLVAALAARNK